MKVGHIIKNARLQQEIKQTVLSKGICSPSYLSRIEQGLTVPSIEIITLLSNRLGINIENFNRIDETDFGKKIEKIYKEVLTKRDKKFTEQELNKLEKENPLFENKSLYYTYLLITLRFRLILGGNFEERRKDLATLDESIQNFSPSHMYLFKLNKAIYYYSIKQPKKSLEFFEEVLSIIDKITLEVWEKAELNYMIGLAYIADNRVVNSIKYIESSVEYFRDNFLMGRVLDCYMLIGITYKKSEQFQEALNTYLKAEKICKEFSLQNRIGIIYHNMGSLKIVMRNNEEGIKYLYKSLKYKTDDRSKLITVFSLVIEYSKKSNEKLVIELCEQGISLLSHLNDESLTAYYHHFQFYKSLHENQGLSEDIAIQAIEYFIKLQDYRHAYKYSIALAESFYSQRKYKLAASYLIEANKYSYINENIERWEEL